MRMLGNLPNQCFAIRLRHPVLRLDFLFGVDACLECVQLLFGFAARLGGITLSCLVKALCVHARTPWGMHSMCHGILTLSTCSVSRLRLDNRFVATNHAPAEQGHRFVLLVRDFHRVEAPSSTPVILNRNRGQPIVQLRRSQKMDLS
jgi:hypothetical protein